MKRSLIPLLLLPLSIALSACQNATQVTPESVAQQVIDKSGKKNVKITKIVKGSEKFRRVDELWCVETDATAADGQTAYLLVVWRKGTSWDGAELVDGEYEWDQNGCPRN